MPKTPRRIAIACFGEALWDILPRGLFLGGAPLNVAYHLSRLGVRALPVSAVGRDFLGDEALRRIVGWEVATDFIVRHRDRATGTVHAALDARGVATYTITRDVAWDRIEVSPRLRREPAPAAIVCGSLALRTGPNRVALARLFARWPEAWRVVDLNLRVPHDRGAGVAFALKHTQFLKLNDDELARMSGGRIGTVRQLEATTRDFAAKHSLSHICVTAGARGAGLLWEGGWHWETGRKTEVRDTIGAGDAFLAAFLAAHLGRGETPRAALAAACRLGEFIAGREGATPPYQIDTYHRPRTTA